MALINFQKLNWYFFNLTENLLIWSKHFLLLSKRDIIPYDKFSCLMVFIYNQLSMTMPLNLHSELTVKVERSKSGLTFPQSLKITPDSIPASAPVLFLRTLPTIFEGRAIPQNHALLIISIHFPMFAKHQHYFSLCMTISKLQSSWTFINLIIKEITKNCSLIYWHSLVWKYGWPYQPRYNC